MSCCMLTTVQGKQEQHHDAIPDVKGANRTALYHHHLLHGCWSHYVCPGWLFWVTEEDVLENMSSLAAIEQVVQSSLEMNETGEVIVPVRDWAD